MASLFSEFSLTFNGNATDEVVGTVTRTRVGPLYLTSAELAVAEEQMFEGVSLQTGSPIPQPLTGFFVIKGTTSVTTTAALAVRELVDDWRLLNARYSPFLGAVTLQTTRESVGGTDIVSTLKVRATDMPPVNVLDASSDMVEASLPGIYLTPSVASITSFYRVNLRSVYGAMFRKSTVETGTQTATTGGATLTTVNTGLRDVGCRIDIGAVTGSPTNLDIVLSGNTLVRITSPTNGQYIEYAYTTPGEFTQTATTTAASTLRVPTGTTNYTAQITTGTGTVAVTISWYPEFANW